MNRIIETERLILRPLEVEDAKDVFEWAGDPVVNRFLPYPVYTDIKKVEEWISSIEEDDNEFGFCLKETGKVIGSGSISCNREKTLCELGYNFNRAYWGKGYATEASKAMIKWAYDELGVRNFTSAHAIANTASGNVIRKCGFQFDRFGQYSRIDGSETYDAAFYKMHLE